MKAQGRRLDHAHRLCPNDDDNGRLPMRIALIVWICASLAGWAAVLLVISLIVW